MEPIIHNQHRGATTLANNSHLECKILEPDLHEKDVKIFVKMHNQAWRFRPIDQETFRKRVSGGTIIGAYLNQQPTTLLELCGLEVDGHRLLEIEEEYDKPLDRARAVCELMPRNYDELIYTGSWHNGIKRSNLLTMVDITTPRELRGNGFADAVVDFFKLLMLEMDGCQRPPHLKEVKYVITFTPKPDDYKEGDLTYKRRVIGFHLRNGAFNTGYVLHGARPNHSQEDAVFMCYLAHGYKPPLGKNHS